MDKNFQGARDSDQLSNSSLASYTASTSGGNSNPFTLERSPEESSFYNGNRPIGVVCAVDGPAETNYGSTLKGHHISKSRNSSLNLGSTQKGIQEQGNNEDSVLVHLTGNSSATIGPVVQQSTKASSDRVKCRKCCTVTLCCSSVVSVVMIIVLWMGFILIEEFPNITEKKSIIFKDRIILLARVDTFWYSFVTVSKERDIQDHMLHAYVVECDNMVVENDIIRYNRTLEVDQNVLLLDPTFLIEGTAFDFVIKILNSSDNGGLLSSVIISGNADSQDIFKQNQSMSSADIVFMHNVSKVTDSFSFTTSGTGYYYVGFKPAGKVQFHVSYDVLGYKYIKPTNQESSCSTQKSGESCNVGLPTTLTNINSDYYCVLCELESNPSYVDRYSVKIAFKVHRSWWNMFTIAVLTLCSLATSCGGVFSIHYVVRSLRRRNRRVGAGYTSIQ